MANRIPTSNLSSPAPAVHPRFVYRQLLLALQAKSRPRADAIADALAVLDSPDRARHFKYFIPPQLSAELTTSERALFESRIQRRRAEAAREKLIFPHTSDEFSLDRAFLRSVLAVEDGPRVKADASFFAMGSCFAVRIADYLREAGRDVSIFDQAEELSSPISNALLLYAATLPPQDQVAYLTKWIALLFAEESEAEQAARVRGKIDELLRLAARARAARCVILTLGNVLDFFTSRDTGAVLANAAPKFMAALADERLRPSDFAERLISRGAIFRMATYAETLEAIGHCLRALRILTPAPIVITVSPVPITAAYGLTGAGNRSAIEIDCISKSRLRSALDDVLTDYEGVFYFPAFEIVRWIAPVTGVSTFGTEDATSRHVSSAVVDAICQLFLTRFLRR